MCRYPESNWLDLPEGTGRLLDDKLVVRPLVAGSAVQLMFH